MNEWKSIGPERNRLTYCIRDGRYITTAVLELPTDVTPDKLVSAIREAESSFLGEAMVGLHSDPRDGYDPDPWDGYDHRLAMAGDRYCSDAEVERIKVYEARSKEAAQRARERKRAADLKTLERLQKKYHGCIRA